MTWIEDFGFRWAAFNHRVSALAFLDDPVRVAVVGGASSTGETVPLPEGCAAETCEEIPFLDEADVALEQIRAQVTGLAVGSAEGTFTAGAGGGTLTIRVPLSRPGRGSAAAWVQGLAVQAEPAWVGDCYHASYGWLPRHLAVAVEDAVLAEDGETVEVQLRGAFAAGPSLEPARACMDDVVDEATVRFTVQVVAVAGRVEPWTERVAHGAAYDFSGQPCDPGEQPDPGLEGRTFPPSAAGTLAGWSGLDFRFHEADPDGRGAYLRSLELVLDPEAGIASGHATNHSPCTQLSAFDYAFVGEVTGVEADAVLERITLEGRVPAELDAAGEPVLYDLQG